MENIIYKEFKIDQDNKLCSLNGENLPLTKKEYNLMVFFLENPNKVHSRSELIEQIWKEEVTERSVDVAISRLKKKLGDFGKNIETRSGFGYSFRKEE